MAKKRKKRPEAKLNKKMRTKLALLFTVITIIFVGLIIRLTYIERTEGARYQRIILSQQEYSSRPIPYRRGDISDSRGTVLATSTDVYNVILDCKVLNEDGDDRPEKDRKTPTLEAFEKCFPEADMNELYRLLKEEPDKQYTVLFKKLPYANIREFNELKEAAAADDKKPRFSNGIWFEKEYERIYPYGSMGSNVVGFIAAGNVGMAGVELSYNETLNGVNGREYGYLNTDNNFERTIKEAKDGDNIILTLDANIQSVVEDKIAAFQLEHDNEYREGPGSTHTAAIVMNPNTGEIYGMGQFPSYDSSNPFDLTGILDQGTIDQMTDEEKLDALNTLWQNYTLTATYEPGSTGKPFTVATGLEIGAMNGSETYLCDGGEYISNYHVRCVSRMGHGIEDIAHTLMNSCNDALMQMSYVIGPEAFTKYQHIFGFGLKTNIDLPGEARTDTLIYPLENMTTLDLATNSFGQNYNCTMIQMASAFSSLINGGYYYQPHVVKKITDRYGNTLKEMDRVLVKQTVSESTSELLRGYLYQTVSEGTAKTAKVNGYSMGGKTGTAQKVPRDGVNYLVSFIGFVPADDPQVVVYVTIDEPNVESQPHSTYAQEIAREILKDILPYLGIYPDEELDPAAEGPKNVWGYGDSVPEGALSPEDAIEGISEGPATELVSEADSAAGYEEAMEEMPLEGEEQAEEPVPVEE